MHVFDFFHVQCLSLKLPITSPLLHDGDRPEDQAAMTFCMLLWNHIRFISLLRRNFGRCDLSIYRLVYTQQSAMLVLASFWPDRLGKPKTHFRHNFPPSCHMTIVALNNIFCPKKLKLDSREGYLTDLRIFQKKKEKIPHEMKDVKKSGSNLRP